MHFKMSSVKIGANLSRGSWVNFGWHQETLVWLLHTLHLGLIWDGWPSSIVEVPVVCLWVRRVIRYHTIPVRLKGSRSQNASKPRHNKGFVCFRGLRAGYKGYEFVLAERCLAFNKSHLPTKSLVINPPNKQWRSKWMKSSVVNGVCNYVLATDKSIDQVHDRGCVTLCGKAIIIWYESHTIENISIWTDFDCHAKFKGSTYQRLSRWRV